MLERTTCPSVVTYYLRVLFVVEIQGTCELASGGPNLSAILILNKRDAGLVTASASAHGRVDEEGVYEFVARMCEFIVSECEFIVSECA